jgi:PAS domain S-box-containing protein
MTSGSGAGDEHGRSGGGSACWPETNLDLSGERYRSIVEAASEGIWIVDSRGKTTFVNPALERMLGYAAAEMLAGRLQSARTKAEVRFLRRDGSILWALVSSAHLSTEDGSVDEVVGMITDITERKALEKELAASERKYRELWESLKSGVVFSDMDGRLRDANPGYQEITGYTTEELSHLSYSDITPEAWRGLDEEALAQVMERGACDLYEKEIIRKDGTVVPIDIRVWLLRDDEGGPSGIWALVRDITDRKRVEEEALKLNRELDGYARSVSHDLRGPLSAVALAASLLRESRDTQEIDELRDEIDDLVGVIERNVDNAHLLINDLLELAKAGQAPQDVIEVVISQAIEDILEEFAQDMRDRGVRLEIATDLGAVRAEATHMTQLFRNLISNAIKHNTSDTPLVKVSKLESERGVHRYLVKDNGPGIPAENMERIFTPFFKSGQGGDTGIGLAIVQKLVKLYGGSIRAYNSDGACFEFEIRDIGQADQIV